MNPLVFPELNYDCINCGKSCTVFEVEIMPDEHQRLLQSPVTVALQKEGYQPLQLLTSGRVYLGKQPGGRCNYLTADSLCRLHAEEGFEAKPWTCRDFPYQAVPTPDGVFVGLSFACTAVARGQGRPVSAHREELEERFGGGEAVRPLTGGVRSPVEFDWRLWDETRLAWDDYRLIEAHLLSMLDQAQDLGLLFGAVQLVRAVREGDLGLLSQPPQPGPGLGEAADSLLRGLITLLETAGDPPQRVEEVLRAFADNRSYHSRCLDMQVELSQLPPDVYPDYSKECREYLRHVIFRKWLLGKPDVVSRVCTLPLVAHALRYFTQAWAMKRGAAPSSADLQEALGVLEGKLMFHARGMESYFGRIGRVFMQEA